MTTFAPNFGPTPTQWQIAIQQNFLERAFQDALLNVLAYRRIADKEVFPGRIGETITKTRVGLMIPNITPLDPSTNTNLDNGLTPTNYSVEQYQILIQQYPQIAPFINLMDDETTIASFMFRNSYNLGIAIATAIDRLCRNSLFNAYMSGNTVVTETLGAPGTSVKVDDIRGFQTVVVNGAVTDVSPSNTLAVTINGAPYLVSGAVADVSNVSSTSYANGGTGGISGTLTTTTNVSVLNGTLGNVVKSNFAPAILRPNNRTSTAAIQSGDLLNVQTILAAVALLRSNAVPRVDGLYNVYLTPASMQEIYQDPEFQVINRGVGVRDRTYADAWVYESLSCRFIMTTEAFVQPAQPSAPVAVLQAIQRPIVCGQGALLEGRFSSGLEAIRNMAKQSGVGKVEAAPSINANPIIDLTGESFDQLGCYHYLRMPLDSLGQIITQTSNFVGGFTVPTDVTTLSTIIPTASNAYYKRAVIIETA